MRRKSSIAIAGMAGLLVASLLNYSFTAKPAAEKDWTGDTYVYQVLFDLGYQKPAFYMENMTPEMAKRGEDIVLHGRTDKPDGKGKSKYVSLYYMCTNCHNTVIEDPVLTVSDPQTRLKYASEHNLPFLQATTFYGIVNRESWYNDDYYKKYGDLVKPARTDVREAIQLCARECSKGRTLEQWEVESIVAYYYSISYKLKDIMTASQIAELNKKKNDPSNHKSLIEAIKKTYALKSPATFVDPPYSRDLSKLPQPDASNGKLIYEHACQTCHKDYGVSDVVFDNSVVTFNNFERKFDKNYWWLFEITRHGTYEYMGHRPYMPLYTNERMSDQQVDDLKAYFDERAKNKGNS